MSTKKGPSFEEPSVKRQVDGAMGETRGETHWLLTGSPRLPFPASMFFLRCSTLRRLNELGETCRVGHRKVREDLAVDGHAGLGQSGHEPAVGNAILARGCVDASDPESAEGPLARLPVAVRILECMVNRFGG